MSLSKRGANVNASARVTVVNGLGNPVSGVTVSGQWSGLTNDSDTGTTDTSGQVTVSSNTVKNPSGVFTFTVGSVAKSGFAYNPSANVETSDSISAP